MDGKVGRVYIGCGQKGEQAARRDALERAGRERLRNLAAEIEQAEKAHLEALERPLNDLEAVCGLLMAVAMELAGYHKPKRWKWRRRRGS